MSKPSTASWAKATSVSVDSSQRQKMAYSASVLASA
jgi:hypothetical protein